MSKGVMFALWMNGIGVEQRDGVDFLLHVPDLFSLLELLC